MCPVSKDEWIPAYAGMRVERESEKAKKRKSGKEGKREKGKKRKRDKKRNTSFLRKQE